VIQAMTNAADLIGLAIVGLIIEMISAERCGINHRPGPG
jgi:hypothetical protein